MATPAALSTDGRTQRSERSREAIVNAMLDLIREGTLSPTAQQVAVRADVGVRTVFRHFSDMETLFATMTERLSQQYEIGLVREAQNGSLAERTERLIDDRIAFFDRFAPYHRSSTLQRARSAFLQAQNDRDIKGLRRDLKLRLPELERAEPAIADAIEMVLSFEAYERLRFDQRLSARRTREAMEAAARKLIDALNA